MPIGEPDKVRLDRWLWSVRIFKSRNLATEACKKNWVKLDGHPAKPSKEIKMGDVITIKLGPLQKIVSVVGLIEKEHPRQRHWKLCCRFNPTRSLRKSQTSKATSCTTHSKQKGYRATNQKTASGAG